MMVYRSRDNSSGHLEVAASHDFVGILEIDAVNVTLADHHRKRRSTTNHTIAARNTRAINDLINTSTSRRMRVHQAATVVSRLEGSTTAISSSPRTTATTNGMTRRTTVAVYQRGGLVPAPALTVGSSRAPAIDRETTAQARRRARKART